MIQGLCRNLAKDIESEFLNRVPRITGSFHPQAATQSKQPKPKESQAKSN